MKTIKLGYEGEEALLLCRELKRNGYSVKESRTFTQEMKEAVIDFQQKNKLDADGIVGYRTWEVLFFTGHPITERLTEEDFILVARLLDVEVTALKAVQQVETGGRGGFFAPGKPAILFEGHIFWNQLKKRNINPESHVKGNENILYPKWEIIKAVWVNTIVWNKPVRSIMKQRMLLPAGGCSRLWVSTMQPVERRVSTAL